MIEAKIASLLKDTDTDQKVLNVIARVVTAEQAKLHQQKPRYITDDIKQIIEEEVKRS